MTSEKLIPVTIPNIKKKALIIAAVPAHLGSTKLKQEITHHQDQRTTRDDELSADELIIIPRCIHHTETAEVTTSERHEYCSSKVCIVVIYIHR